MKSLMPWGAGMEVFQVRNKAELSKERLASLDALRGFDMFWIIGGDIAFKGLDKVFNNDITRFIALQMDHAHWRGVHFYDIIMPLFLFLVGVSMVYSFRKRLAGGATDRSLWKHTLKRAAILWILGIAVQGNLFTYSLDKIDLYSNTLQAIATGYVVATIFILYLPVRGQIFATAALLCSYWAIVALVPVQGTTANAYEMTGNLPMYVDKLILGKFMGYWHYAWIIPSLNFAATVMLGVFCGYMMQSSKNKISKFNAFILLGAALILAGLVWDTWHPVIKKIWTGSFVLFSGGICVLLLGIFYLLMDVWKLRKGTGWMIVIGSNAIFAYVAWHLFEHQFTGVANVFLAGLEPWTGNWQTTLSYAGGFGVLYLILKHFYKYNILIKI